MLQRSNDYDRGVINGDVGTVTSVRWQPAKRGGKGRGGYVVGVRFEAAGGGGAMGEGVDAEYFGGQAGKHLELAYAMTVHKAQGSEWPVVVLAMHTSHFPMLSRGLAYTALSRAKRLLVVVGTKQAMAIAAGRSEGSSRCTGLTQRLRDAADGVRRATANCADQASLLAPASAATSQGGPAEPGESNLPAVHDPWQDLGVGDVLGQEAPAPSAQPTSTASPSPPPAQQEPSPRYEPHRPLSDAELHNLWASLHIDAALSTQLSFRA